MSKVSLSLHTYAPELSRIAVYNRRELRRTLRAQRAAGHAPVYPAPVASYPAGGADTIAKARAVLRKRWGYPDSYIPQGYRRVSIVVEYPPGHECAPLARTMTGLVMGYREALAARDAEARKVAPGGRVRIKMHAPPVVRYAGPFDRTEREADAVGRWRDYGARYAA